MVRIREKLRSLTYENKLFFQILILVTIPMAVMGIVSCNIYIKSESAKSRLTLNSYSEEISREYENILSALKEYYIEVANSDTFRWLVRQEKEPYSLFSNLKQAQRSLEGNYFMADYVKDYEFINVNHKWIFNNYGMFPFDKLKNREETEQFLEEQKEMLLSVYWLNRQDSKTPKIGNMRVSNTVDSSGLILILKEESGIGGLSWLLSVRLDGKSLAGLSEGYKKLGYDVAVIGNDTIFLDTSQDMTETYLQSGKKDSGIYKNSKGRKYNINVKSDGLSGLTYVVGYDTSKVKQDATVFVWISFAIIAAFAALLILVRLTAVAFAKPLLMLEKFIADQNGQIKELLVSNMIKGELNEEKMNEALRKSKIAPCAAYRMILLICKHDKMEEKELKDSYNRILEQFPDELRREVFITPVYYREKLVFLVGADSDAEVDTRTAYLYKGIKDFIEETTGLLIASGISQPFHQLHHVRRAYSECAEALYNRSNQVDMKNSSMVLFDDYLVMNSVGDVYDMILENELIQAIEGCKEEESVRFLELIIERMDLKDVVGIERNFYLTRLLTAMLNLPVAAGVSLSDVFDSEQYNVLNQITQIYDKKRLAVSVREEIIHPIIATLLEKRQQGEEPEIVKKVMAMIKEKKGDITLNECADALSYHPNYLSKVLKKEKGVTFTDIINGEKLKQAKYMLLTTEYSIAEIAEKLQYNNVQNFIRFFKNHVEVTPASFRKEHRK